MKYILLIFLSSNAIAYEYTEFIQGLTFGYGRPSVNTNVVKDNRTFKFLINNKAATVFGLKTKIGEIQYYHQNNEPENSSIPETGYKNIYFKTQAGSLEFRLNKHTYSGAHLKKGEFTGFYQGYNNKGRSGKVSYYKDKHYLDLIQFDTNKKTNVFKRDVLVEFSSLYSLFYDHRELNFPDISDEGDDLLPSSFRQENIGILFGFDGLAKWNYFFIRAKLSLGYSRVISTNDNSYDSGTIPIDVDISIGTFVGKNHLIKIDLDFSALNTSSEIFEVNSGVSHLSLLYRYSF